MIEKKKFLSIIAIGIAFIIFLFSKEVFAAEEININYNVHIQDFGWQQTVKNGAQAGTTGKSLRLEAIKIQLPENDIDIKYQVYIQDIGWQDWKKSGEIAGTYGQSLRLEGIKILLDSSEKYSIMYRVHIQDIGWQDWKYDGQLAGIEGKGLRLEAIQIKIVEKEKTGIAYKTHVQNIGWQNTVHDGAIAGTEGKLLRMEAININLINAPANAKVKYKVHVQDIGWQDWKYNGQLAGTEGKLLRVEAIQIKLENIEDYSVEYKVHIQDIGWTKWYSEGNIAGTVGQSKRLEAIKIRLVQKENLTQYTGIDVSQYNGTIDWNLIKNDGIDYAMIRVGYRGYGLEGNFAQDAKFIENITQAKRAGMPVGIYFVTQATNKSEAIEEANWVLDKIKNYKLEYPVAIDIEKSTSPTGGRADNLDKKTRTELAKIFCETIQNAGYVPIIYTNVDWATNYLIMSELSEFDTWIASYKYDPQKSPGYNGKYTMWQYSDKGIINGISSYTDLNICYKKY